MKTTIVAISVNFYDARKVCNLIQEQVFETYQDLRNYLTIHLEIDEDDEEQPQFFSLDDFMEECNDQLFNFEGTFISYVKVAKMKTKKQQKTKP